MQPLLAETVPHRARLTWFAGLFVAAILTFAFTHHGYHRHRHVAHPHGMPAYGHCVEMTPMPSAQVHAFYVHY
jgi:hypothetical protein